MTSYININGQQIPFIGTEFLHGVDLTQKFKDARTFSGTAVTVDMEIARDVQRDRIRAARVPLMRSLDAKFMKALETGASTTEIVAQKQALRDAPKDPRIEAAQTPSELLALTLDVLIA